MKKVAILSLVCVSYLLANNSSEIYQRAMDFEAKGDYKAAMNEYKKLATQAVTPQNSITKQESVSLKADNYPIQNNEVYETPAKPKTTKTSKKALYPKANAEDKQFLYVYNPNYIGYAYDFDDKDDRKHGEVKFQISLEKPLFDNLLGLDETWSVSYTQTSFWQTAMDSAPFRTTDYQPEVYVTVPTDFWGLDYIRAGYNHQSNGEDYEKSRSWNRAFLQTSFALGDVRVTPRVWHSFTFDEANDGIRQYMGYGDIKLDYDIKDHSFSALWRNNLRFDSQNRGALELNWYFPLLGDIKGFVQYFTGYGESLEDFNNHVDKAMIGIAILGK